MKKQEYEKSIQNKLQSYRPEVDQDKLWSSLSAHVPKKKKRRAFWIPLLLVFLAGMGVSFLFLKENEVSLEEKQHSNSQKIELSHNNEELLSGISAIADDNEILESNTKLKVTGQTKPNEIESKFDEGKESSDHSNTALSDGSTDSQLQIQSPGLNHVSIHEGAETQKTGIKNLERSAESPVEIREQNDEIIIASAKRGDSKVDKKRSSLEELNNVSEDAILSDQESKANPSFQRSKYTPALLVSTLKFNSVRSLDENAEEHRGNQPDINPSTQFLSAGAPSIKKAPGRHFSLAFAAGIGMVSSVHEIGSNAEAIDYQTLVKSAESELPLLQALFGIKYQIGKRTFASTGLQYRRFTTRLAHEWQEYEPIITQGISSVIIDENGQQVEVVGPVESTEITTHSAIRYSYLHSFEIPVLLGYDILRTPLLKTAIQAGVILNPKVLSSGPVMSEDGQLEDLEAPYANSFNLGWQVGAEFSLRLNKSTSIVLSPLLTRSSIQYNVGEIQGSKRFTVLSVTTGIAYKFQ